MENSVAKYFPDLTPEQESRLAAMKEIYDGWNRAINVISRKDFENFYTNHVLHSLAIAKIFTFGQEQRILDIGTGGGFPGIPLAIMFPDAHFVLLDSIAKKIRVVDEVVRELKLNNVTTVNCRAEVHQGKYSHVVTRAVASLSQISGWCAKNIAASGKKSGLIALKGGDLTDELKDIRKPVTIWNISDLFQEPCFQSKKVVWVRF